MALLTHVDERVRHEDKRASMRNMIAVKQLVLKKGVEAVLILYCSIRKS